MVKYANKQLNLVKKIV